MSLIDDALRRAQAAQTPGPAGGAAFRAPMPLPDPWRHRRRRMRRFTATAAAVAALLAGGFLFFSRRGSRGPVPSPDSSRQAPSLLAVPPISRSPTSTGTPAPASSGAAAARAASRTPTRPNGTPSGTPTAPPAAASPTRGAVSSTRTPSPARGASAAAPPPTPRAAPRELPKEPVLLPPVEVGNASGSPRVAAPEPSPRAETAPAPTRLPPTREPTRAPTRPPASQTRTYAGTASTPSGKLELEGIVYSEANPTALINGRVVAPGGFVDGYTVISIGRDRVELEGASGRIILTLK